MTLSKSHFTSGVLGSFCGILLSFACSADQQQQSTDSSFEIVEAFPSLAFDRPVDLQSAGDKNNRLFVVEQPGRIRVFDNSPDAGQSQVFLDIQSRVRTQHPEEGLLGLAFHPRFADNGLFFVYYSVSSPRRTRLSRFAIDTDDPTTADPSSEQVILEIEQPYGNHNGGQIAFGPDGYLYIGTGDGGAANDPHDAGQDLGTLLGKILRIDIEGDAPYTSPLDNPFAGGSDEHRSEIYAYGLRNPWRFSFDTATGRLWVGDVGQNAFEEIDIVAKGGNYGWRTMEASICRPPTQGCGQEGLELPVWEYRHRGGGRSVTGGFVYRGAKLPDLVGAYVYADFVTGEVWRLDYNGEDRATNTLIEDTSLFVSSFGVDDQDELYICDYRGKIYTLEPGSAKK